MEKQSTISKQMVRTAPAGSLLTILGLWFSTTVVNFMLAWGLVPLIPERLPIPASAEYWSIMTLGAAWQIGITLWAVYRQEESLRWASILRVLRLKPPVDPKSGQAQARTVWRGLGRWWLVGLIMGVAMLVPVILFYIRRYLPPDTLTSPLLVWPAYSSFLELTSPEFSRQWGMLPVALLGWAVLAFSEELLFRGLLLPGLSREMPKRACIFNALLFCLYSLYQFWLIPFRFLEGWILARAANRYQSTWMAFAARGIEGVGVGLLTLSGIITPSLKASSQPVVFPYIVNRPAPTVRYTGHWTAIPEYNPDNTAPFQVDLRGADLSGMDFRRLANTLAFADFDTHTVWPEPDRMPVGFNPAQILEMGKNPGLELHLLHGQGITGNGVGIAIIDQALLTEHGEYADRLRWYEELPGYPTTAQMHGPAVSSIAVGKTVGVAPEADLYYISGSPSLATLWLGAHQYAEGIRRIIQINSYLPADRKIRVISISSGWLPSVPGYQDVRRATGEAEAAGMMVISTGTASGRPAGTYASGLGRDMMADPEDFQSYGPGLWWANSFYARGFHTTGLPTFSGDQLQTLLFPMDSRAMASETGANDYFFNRNGGQSWVVPYIAGLYALAAQVDPAITPEQFWQALIQTGEILTVEHDGQTYTPGKVVNPARLIDWINRKVGKDLREPH